MKTMKNNSYGMGGKSYRMGGKLSKKEARLLKMLMTKMMGEKGMRVMQNSGLTPQITFDMDKTQMIEGRDDYSFFDDPEARLQQKVNLGLASKAQRDDKSFTRDFNPIPVGDFYDDISEYNRQVMRDSEVGKMVDAGQDILKIRGELVPYDYEKASVNRGEGNEDYAKVAEMLRSREEGEDSDYFGPQDIMAYQYMLPSRRKGGVTAGILDQTGMGDRGFTRAELGSGQTPFDQRVGQVAEDVATRGLRRLKDRLDEDRARYADLYDRRARGQAALPGGKLAAGGRTPFRLLKKK